MYDPCVATSTLAPGSRTRTSSILLKTVMALTGLIFIGYVLAHMYGNLKIFSGAEAFDDYAHHLRILGAPYLPYSGGLWIVRVVLLASLVLHAYAAYVLWARAGQARKSRYVVRRASRAAFYSKAMRWGGTALLLFVVFHLLHFTTNTIQVNGDFASPAQRVVSSFQVWWVVLVYLLAVVALGLHLLHGVYAAGMTLGLNTSARAAGLLKAAGAVIAVVTVVGFMAPPLAILFGVIP